MEHHVISLVLYISALVNYELMKAFKVKAVNSACNCACFILKCHFYVFVW